jgi:hypothetical protein
MFLVSIFLFTGVSNCFGKFALTRKIYGWNSDLKIGDGKVVKVFQTLLMYGFTFLPVYLVASLLDLLIFNLLEFWMDTNIVGFNEYDKNGTFTKNIQQDGANIKLVYLNYGNRLNLEFTSGTERENWVVLRNEPGKMYKEEDGKLVEITVQSRVIGDKMILKMAENGKLTSSTMVNVKDYQQLEKKYAEMY